MERVEWGGAPRFGRGATIGGSAPLFGAAALALLLGACAAAGLETSAPPTKAPVTLRAVPRDILVVPRTEWVWLWDRPGGPAARALRLTRVPSGTEGVLVAVEPASPASEIWDGLLLENLSRQPVRWVKVATPAGEGWVRAEFVEPR